MIKPAEITDKLITVNGFIIVSWVLLSQIMFQKEKIFAPNIGCWLMKPCFCLLLIFVLGFVSSPIMRRKQKKCVFWPQHYYRLVIRPKISRHRPHLTLWLGSGFPSQPAQYMIFPVISVERLEWLVTGTQLASDTTTGANFLFWYKNRVQPCSTSVACHETSCAIITVLSN